MKKAWDEYIESIDKINKEIADKYFTHLGRTKESQDMILDYIANDVDIDSDKLLKVALSLAL